MYHHIKKLMYAVNVGTPDPRFGNMLLEQFGGANGELAAAMQYSIQSLNCDDPDRKDMLMDIGTEELSHLWSVGASASLKPIFQQASCGTTRSPETVVQRFHRDRAASRALPWRCLRHIRSQPDI